MVIFYPKAVFTDVGLGILAFCSFCKSLILEL